MWFHHFHLTTIQCEGQSREANWENHRVSALSDMNLHKIGKGFSKRLSQKSGQRRQSCHARLRGPNARYRGVVFDAFIHDVHRIGLTLPPPKIVIRKSGTQNKGAQDVTASF